MSHPTGIEDLLKQLDAQHVAYVDTLQRFHQMLREQVSSTTTELPAFTTLPEPQSPISPRQSDSRAISEQDGQNRKLSTGLSTLRTSADSKATGEESDEEDDQSYYVQEELESQSHEHDDLREHLRNYEWDEYCARILESVIDKPSRLEASCLFPTRSGPVPDRSHYSHYQVFDVGTDGAPVPVDTSAIEQETSKAMAMWHAIRETNHPLKERKAVGRITIAREPSPILFGALHLVMHSTFDIDELFRHLVESEQSSAHMHRAFDDDPRRQSTFVFSFEYFTIIGEECKPMSWQRADRQLDIHPEHHIPITRCSSVVALALNGKPIRKLRNPARRATNNHGFAYDIWSSWQVLNIQCYADWKSTTDVHDSTKHYVNGSEAFMATLLGEYRDAQRRFEDIYKRITRLITPPLEFMFDSNLRDKLLFEDDQFTYSRRYFWAFQTFGIINDSIKSMIDAYEDTFTDTVWEGKHKTLWPLPEQDSPRSVFYRRKMAGLRKAFEAEIRNLRTLLEENNQRRSEIRSLRDQLFSGTSVLESRKSVEQTEITVQQGHNIKLLTLVSIFFLPLTFVTSVFGMTNMPTEHRFWMFGITTATVCIPFLVLIGSLNSSRGMRFWKAKTQTAFVNTGLFLRWMAGFGQKIEEQMGREDGRNEGLGLNSGIRSQQSTSAKRGRARQSKHSQKIDFPASPTKESDQSYDTSTCQAGDKRPGMARAPSSRLAELLRMEARKDRNRQNHQQV